MTPLARRKRMAAWALLTLLCLHGMVLCIRYALENDNPAALLASIATGVLFSFGATAFANVHTHLKELRRMRRERP